MDDRWTLLLSRLRERFPDDADPEEVESYLAMEGYDRRQIGEIVLAFYSDSGPDTEPRPGPPETAIPFRVLGAHERGRFTAEAWGFLLALSDGGMVTLSELEAIIERALAQLEGRIALDDLRSLMESGGFDEFGPAPDHVTIH